VNLKSLLTGVVCKWDQSTPVPRCAKHCSPLRDGRANQRVLPVLALIAGPDGHAVPARAFSAAHGWA